MKIFTLTEGCVQYILKTNNTNFKSPVSRNNSQYLNNQTTFFVKKKVQNKSFDTQEYYFIAVILKCNL